MSTNILKQKIENYQSFAGKPFGDIVLSYQVFGQKIHTAPVVFVIHALTGSSDVMSEEKGWWKPIVGKHKLIDSEKYCIIAFNIPGNGYENQLIENYHDFTAKDIAKLFIQALHAMGIKQLHAAIGGSLGGGIAWEMAVLEPKLIRFLIPIASDWKSTDWMIGHNFIQENILNSSPNPIETARMMAMLFYRTPASLKAKFDRTKMPENKMYRIESWLQHHGNKLNKRFSLLAYKTMNHLLTTLNVAEGKESFESAVKNIQSEVIQVAVDSDLFFVKEENIETKAILDKLNIKNHYFEIKSIHGHDAFLIEFEQLTHLLNPYF